MKMFRQIVILLVSAALCFGAADPLNQLRLCLRHDPKTFDPLKVDEDAGETIRYLTGGVLIRVNRITQRPEPELATSWKFADNGRRITFEIRAGVRFSDGTPFAAADVKYTIERMMDPALRSPTGDSFRTGTRGLQVRVESPLRVSISFPTPIAGVERLFDQVAIMSRTSPKKEMAGLGPFVVSEYKAGSHIALQRNPHYWKRDSQGRQLPYLDSIRFDIQANRDIELLRFRRGEIHMISGLDADAFDRLKGESGRRVMDAGPSYDTEMLWFNQVAAAPIAAHKKAWFRSRAFRRAVSHAINRTDIVRLVYRGHARPAAGPLSSVDGAWVNTSIRPDAGGAAESLRLLEKDGFRLKNRVLYDGSGNAVEFSLITNSGNKARARIASIIQQDLARIGIRMNVVPLDFASLIERINRTFSYDACLLGLVNVDPDPNGQMNIWLSSGANHQWNPGQKAPATAWEAEIDQLMRKQASTVVFDSRKAAFNRVQEIVADQVPFIYLISKNSLIAVTPRLKGIRPSALRPQLYWNAEFLHLGD
jgi:peptide/nickel transport system substrate-binding protein